MLGLDTLIESNMSKNQTTDADKMMQKRKAKMIEPMHATAAQIKNLPKIPRLSGGKKKLSISNHSGR